MDAPRIMALAQARSGRTDWEALVEASRAVFIWQLTRILRHRSSV